MAEGFRGSETQTIDAKGRVSIPHFFRDAITAGDPKWTEGLRPRLVIVYGPKKQDHLKCYTIARIRQIEKRIDRMPLGSRERLALEKIYHALAVEVQVFEDGRIQLPAKIREKLAFDKGAHFVAASDKFLIYKPETYEAHDADVDEWLDEQGEDYDYESALPELDEPDA